MSFQVKRHTKTITGAKMIELFKALEQFAIVLVVGSLIVALKQSAYSRKRIAVDLILVSFFTLAVYTHIRLIIEKNQKTITKGITMETKIVDVRLYKDYKEKDQEWITLAEQAHETKKIAKHFADEAASLLNKLKSLSDDTSCHGGDFVFKKDIRMGAVDYMSIPAVSAMDPIERDKYRKPESCQWKLERK